MDEDSVWWRLIYLNPALWRGLVVSVVALLASAGVIIAPAVPDATISVIVIVAAIVQAVWTRRGVTPNGKVVVYVPDPVNRPDEVSAGAATTGAGDDAVLAAARATPSSW